jgi:hypothetical protein
MKRAAAKEKRGSSGHARSYLQTRVRASRLQNAARLLAFIELSRRLHQAYRQAYDKQAAGQLLPQNPSPTPPAQPLPPNYKPPQDVEQPCVTRSNDVRRDLRAIARMLHGKVTGFQLGQRFPGGQIDPRGQSFERAVNTLTRNGFSPNYSLDHPEGEGYQKKFSDGLWYHVVVNFPKDAEDFGFYFDPHPKSPTPLVTAHCHATNPNGLTHLMDTIFGP